MSPRSAPQKSTESARSCAHGPSSSSSCNKLWVANYEHGRPSNGDRNSRGYLPCASRDMRACEPHAQSWTFHTHICRPTFEQSNTRAMGESPIVIIAQISAHDHKRESLAVHYKWVCSGMLQTIHTALHSNQLRNHP